MSIRLSVNVNKVATLRNSRGGQQPRVLDAVTVCLDAGVNGITVHPRADRRHITPDDVRDIARLLEGRRPDVEYNIEGDPRPDLVELVQEVRPDQCTLVPVVPGEITSQAGWADGADTDQLTTAMRGDEVERHSRSACSSMRGPTRFGSPPRWAPIASNSTPSRSPERSSASVERGAAVVRGVRRRRHALAHTLGVGVNAGHDLDLHNLVLFRKLPHLDEVSIGHALMSRALFVGLDTVVREYLSVLTDSGSQR